MKSISVFALLFLMSMSAHAATTNSYYTWIELKAGKKQLIKRWVKLQSNKATSFDFGKNKESWKVTLTPSVKSSIADLRFQVWKTTRKKKTLVSRPRIKTLFQRWAGLTVGGKDGVFAMKLYLQKKPGNGAPPKAKPDKKGGCHGKKK